MKNTSLYIDEIGRATKKNENYKYTNLKKAFPETLTRAEATESGQGFAAFLATLPAKRCQVVFGNGVLNQELTDLPEGLEILDAHQPFSFDGTQLEDPFYKVSQSFGQKEVTLRLKKNQQIPLTVIIHDLDLEENQTSLPRLNIECEQGSLGSFLEVYRVSSGFESTVKAQSIGFTHLEVAANAHVNHTKVILAGMEHTHVGSLTANLYRDANLNSLTFTGTGGINRNNIEVNVLGEGAHATVNGLYTGREKQHQDNFTLIHHKAPHTTSEQLFKGIMDESSHGIFTGKIVIHRDAQQVDSSQLNKNLLLSKKAHVDTRPQIEVYADDVKCGHGATVGQINQEEVFYLESRGIERAKAQKILCHAFAQDVLETCPNKEVTQFLSHILFEQFEKFALENLEEKLVD